MIAGLKRLRVDALVTIGGDDTLKTANYLRHMGVKVVHVPKTIDNDYYGIAWTFGYFTAIDVAKDVIANLYADAAVAIAARRAGAEPDPLTMHFPTARDGAIGLAFVEAAIRSNAEGGAWTDALGPFR